MDTLITLGFLSSAALMVLWIVVLVIRRVKEAGASVPLIMREVAESSPVRAPSKAAGEADDEPRDPPISLVLLQSKSYPLLRAALVPLIRRATGLEITDDESSQAYWAMPPMEKVCPFVLGGHMFSLTSIPETYTTDRDWYVDDDTPPELLSAWQKHRAFLSIDLVASQNPGEAMALIGRMAAELADDETVAVVHPAARHAVAFDPEVRTMLRKRAPQEVVDGPLRAFALLRRVPRGLTQIDLTAAAERAWGRRPGTSRDGVAWAVMSEDGMGLLQIEGVHIGIGAGPGRYVADVNEAAAEIDDLRIRRALEAHNSWWGVDFMAAATGVTKARMYQLLGRLAAEFLDGGVTMLFSTEYRRATVYDEKVRERLRGSDPLAAVFHTAKPPLLQVKGDDPAMRAAVAEARRRWPEFVAAFLGRKAGHHFAIKRGFRTGREDDHQEFMWVQVTELRDAEIIGTLDNDPMWIPTLKAGDRVTSTADDVVDWIYRGDEELVGNFTGPVILAAQRNRD